MLPNGTHQYSGTVYHSTHSHYPPHRPAGPLPVNDVAREYIKTAIDYDNISGNTKYCLAQIMHQNMETAEGRKLMAAHTMEEIWLV